MVSDVRQIIRMLNVAQREHICDLLERDGADKRDEAYLKRVGKGSPRNPCVVEVQVIGEDN